MKRTACYLCIICKALTSMFLLHFMVFVKQQLWTRTTWQTSFLPLWKNRIEEYLCFLMRYRNKVKQGHERDVAEGMIEHFWFIQMEYVVWSWIWLSPQNKGAFKAQLPIWSLTKVSKDALRIKFPYIYICGSCGRRQHNSLPILFCLCIEHTLYNVCLLKT